MLCFRLYSSNTETRESVEKKKKNWVIKLFLFIHNSFTIVHLLRTHHCIYGKRNLKIERTNKNYSKNNHSNTHSAGVEREEAELN